MVRPRYTALGPCTYPMPTLSRTNSKRLGDLRAGAAGAFTENVLYLVGVLLEISRRLALNGPKYSISLSASSALACR